MAFQTRWLRQQRTKFDSHHYYFSENGNMYTIQKNWSLKVLSLVASSKVDMRQSKKKYTKETTTSSTKSVMKSTGMG